MTQYEILRLAYNMQKEIWYKAMEASHRMPEDKIAKEMERIAFEALRTLSYMMAEELKSNAE